jgi:RimJ/RimL family protein N-acetyltransferase
MEITYRKLGINDAKAYRRIRLESLKAHPESFGATYEEQSKQLQLMFEEALERPVDDRFVIGAFDQDELVGIFGFVPFVLESFQEIEHAGTLIQMYVKSTHRGMKGGLNLTTAVIKEAFKIPGIEQLILGVRKNNLSAIRVYEQAGFQSYTPEIVHNQVRDVGFQKMIMGK